MKTLSTVKTISISVCSLVLVGLLIAWRVFKIDVSIAFIVFFVLLLLLLIIVSFFSIRRREDYNDIEFNFDESAKLALKEGKIGILTYDKNYKISFVSDMFVSKNLDYMGEKLLTLLPDLQGVIDGSAEVKNISINNDRFEVRKQPNNYALIFRDISKEYDLEKRLKDEACVLGLCNFDNYDEANENEDIITYVNANIKLPVIDYFKKYGIVFRTLRNNRLQLILNYSKYQQLLKDRFSILNVVRRESKKIDLNITLSMAFALDYEELSDLDNEVSNLLDIAQTRGGDQVVIKQSGKEAIFYGGSSEAREKQSKVKVRVMANSFKNLINDSSDVLVVGHKEADADCVGSMFAIASIAKTMKKDVFVLIEENSIEPMTNETLNTYEKEINDEYNIVSENEALTHLDDNSIVVMCDHHSLDQTYSKMIVQKAKKVCIIDHHRRKEDLEVDVSFIYTEASASSTCELVCEFFQYFPKVNIIECVANIMYLGIVIDTNHFRSRTGMRTFDAAKTFKMLGADPLLVEKFVQEPYINVKKRTDIMNCAKKYNDSILISCLEDGIFPRSIASQASDLLIQTKEIEAVFTICYSTNEEIIITARSKGNVNVQVIMEKMDGGGHMTAAGLQRKGTTPIELKNELINVLSEYFAERNLQDEGNIA